MFLLCAAETTPAQWHVPSRLHVNPLEAKPRGSSWPLKLHAKVHHLQVEWRNLTDTGKHSSACVSPCTWVILCVPCCYSTRLEKEYFNLGCVSMFAHLWWFMQLSHISRLSVRQPWYCGASRDPSVPKVHRAAYPQAAIPAPGEGNRPGFQDRSPLPGCRHWGPAGCFWIYKQTSYSIY